MRKYLFILVLLTGALAGAAFIFKGQVHSSTAPTATQAFNSFYISMTTYHERMMDALPDGIIAFIGDSHFQAMPVNFIVPEAVNLGIGGDTIQGVTKRLKGYKKLNTAKAIVLNIGVNNLSNGYTPETLKVPTEQMLKNLPDKPLLWVAVPPIDESTFEFTTNKDIAAYNNHIQQLCEARKNCVFSSFPESLLREDGLSSNYHIGDGLHLNGAGYKVWQEKIKTDLASLLK